MVPRKVYILQSKAAAKAEAMYHLRAVNVDRSQCHSRLNFDVGSYIQSVDTGCGLTPFPPLTAVPKRGCHELRRRFPPLLPVFFFLSFFSYLTFQLLALPPESSIITAYGAQGGPSNERIRFLKRVRV